jgi:hypothetical protein
MKTAKVIVLSMLFSTFCVGTLLAQTPDKSFTPEDRAAKATEHLKKTLNLTDDQASKVKALNAQFWNDQVQFRKAQREARENEKAKMQAHQNDLKQILTPEQFQKYQDIQKRMRNHMRYGMHHRRFDRCEGDRHPMYKDFHHDKDQDQNQK